MKEIIPFITAPKGPNLLKFLAKETKVQVLKPHMVKKLRGSTTENVPCSWIKRLRLTIVQRTIFFNTTSKFNTILIKIPVGLFAETVNLILKSTDPAQPRNPRKQNKRLPFPNFKAFSQAMIVKTAWFGQEGGRGDHEGKACKQSLTVMVS